MLVVLQRMIIRCITPLVWKSFPGRKVRALRRFATVERDSGFRFLQYTSHMQNPASQAKMFAHAVEEFHHADLFDDQVRRLDAGHAPVIIQDRQFVITESSSPKDVAEAYGYAHIGETLINRNFAAYNNRWMPRELGNLFDRISRDEQRHAELTDDLLLEMVQEDQKQYRSIVRRAYWRRQLEEYSRFASKFGEVYLNLVLLATYFLVGSLTTRTLRKRLEMPRTEQLAVFRDQLVSFQKWTSGPR